MCVLFSFKLKKLCFEYTNPLDDSCFPWIVIFTAALVEVGKLPSVLKFTFFLNLLWTIQTISKGNKSGENSQFAKKKKPKKVQKSIKAQNLDKK